MSILAALEEKTGTGSRAERVLQLAWDSVKISVSSVRTRGGKEVTPPVTRRN